MPTAGWPGWRRRSRPGRGRDRAHGGLGGEPVDALAERAVADLIVVLEERDERGQRKVGAGLPARRAPIRRVLALKAESLGEAARQHADGVLIVDVVAAPVARDGHVQRVVDVVVPLGGVEAAAVWAAEVARLVPVVLQDEVHVAIAPRSLQDRAADLVQHVNGRIVVDLVGGVEPEAVQVVLLDPVERVVAEERADDLAPRPVEVHGGAPRRLVSRAGERGRVGAEVVALGTEVVVDHVEEDGEVARVARLDQRLQLLGAAVAAVRRERQHTVVAPVPPPGEIGDRHQLDGRHPEIGQVVESIRHAPEGALGSERADVELVDGDLVPRPPAPAGVLPRKRRRIDHLARPADVLRLKARRRIGHGEPAVDQIAIARARPHPGHGGARPAVRRPLDGDGSGAALERELDATRAGRPQGEPHAFAGANLGAERHPMDGPHLARASRPGRRAITRRVAARPGLRGRSDCGRC